MIDLFKKKTITVTAEDIRTEIYNRAVNRTKKEVEIPATTVPTNDNPSYRPTAKPALKRHPYANTLEELSKLLKDLEDKNNEKVDTLRLLYLYLEKDGENGFKRKNLIKFLSEDSKPKVKRVINVTVTKN